MAGNTNNGFRKGAVKERSQTYNPKTQQYVKRDTTTGRFMSTSDNKYKGITLEKSDKEKEIKKEIKEIKK
jgi:hypothetical protein